MSLDLWTLAAITGMALVTYACRGGGYWLFTQIKPTPLLRSILAHIPGTLFVSFVVPAVVAGGVQAQVGAVATIDHDGDHAQRGARDFRRDRRRVGRLGATLSAAANARGGRGPTAWIVLAGSCATLLGVGLQRFAYAPLLPAMVEAGWLTPGAAGTLGAANFGGYLIGAIAAAAFGRALGLRAALRACMVTAATCFLLCGVPGARAWGMAWLLPWRTLAGIAGGGLMVLAGPAVQQAVPPAARGLAAGVMFAGVGLGVVVAAVLVPAMLPAGVSATWLALAAASYGLVALSWTRWPDVPPPPPLPMPRLSGATGRLLISYGFAAVAATPHMIFWPDFIARELGRGTNAGAVFWLLWGLGGMAGPAAFGWIADRVGPTRAYRAALALQVLAVVLPMGAIGVSWIALPALVASSLAAGAAAIGLTAMALTCARAIDLDAAPAIWRVGTANYGAAQVLTGFALAAVLARTGSHFPMFALAIASACVALAIQAVPRRAFLIR